MSQYFRFPRWLCLIGTLLAVLAAPQRGSAVIRDGGIDPANLGKGEWIYSMKDATNKLGGTVSAVTSTMTLFQYYKNIGVRYVLIKVGTGSTNYTGCSFGSPHQVTAALCSTAHSNGVWVFGYTRSYGSDIPGESALASSCFNNGADGFVFDAEAEWETGHAWITNGSAQAWSLMSTVRSNWPTKFLGHAPFPIIYLHATFPYKEFGYFSDAIMPQVYHFSSTGLKGSQSAGINWSDVNWQTWQNSIAGTSTNINGQTVFWSDAIKPLVPVQDVYGPAGTMIVGSRCNGTTAADPDKDVMEFIDYAQADPNCVTTGGYNGVNFWRADLHGSVQFTNIALGSSGDFSDTVNNIVIDDANATRVGTWTAVKTFSATTTAGTFTGYTGNGTGIDTNSFGTNYYTKAQGTGLAYIQFTPTVKVAGDYNVYQWHPDRPEASAAVPFTISYFGGTATVNANQTTNGGNWSFVGRYPFAVGTNGTIRVYDNFPEASAVAMVDGLKMVFVKPTSVPTAPSGLTATATNSSQINLTWSDNSSNESSFTIRQSTTSGGPYTDVATVAPNATAYSVTNLSADTTYYFVVSATNYLGASANSTQASAKTFAAGGTAPSITQQPQNQTVAVGSNATFSVTATGTAPLAYQWRYNTVNIAGATLSTYTRSNVQLSDAGAYSVVVTNSYGSVTSSDALLTVSVIAPSITSQPQSATNNAGTTASFTVTASGTAPLTYQWKKNGSTLSNGANVSGATTTNLVLTTVASSDAADYSVTVSNSGGSTTSSNATLVVNSVPSITSQPSSRTNSAGTSAIFTVSASGSQPLSYQWKKNGSTLVTGGNIVGATSSSLTINSVTQSDAANYTVVVTNTAGTVTSSAAALIVIDPPIITTQPVSRTNNAGTLAAFTVVTSGTSPTLQWRKNSVTLANGGNISGATTTNLNIASVTQTDAASYTLVASNSAGSVTSVVATLTVITPPSISTQPQNQTVSVGGNASFSVSVSGSSPFIYRWRFNGATIAGATDSSYSKSSVQTNDAGNYSVVITNAAGSVTTSNALLTVNVGQTRVITVSNIWNITAGSRSYVAVTNTERGLAINTISNHVLIVSRATNANGTIIALDANTGADLNVLLNTPTNVITTAQFPLNKIGVTSNGVVYAANLTTSTSIPFRIYRWVNYSDTPTVAYSGAPDGGATARWGDSFAVRGTGPGTQIIMSGSTNTTAIIFTTIDGTNFTPKVITPSPSVTAGAFGKGLCFGPGNTFYIKTRPTSVSTNYTFNLSTGTATVNSLVSGLDGNMIAIGVDNTHSLLTGVIDDATTNNSGHLLKTFDITDPGSPTLLTTFNFPSFGSGTNSGLNTPNFAGHVDTDGSKVIGLDTQNGIVAAQVDVQVSPSIVTQPQDQTIPQGQPAVFTVVSSGATPLSYQWKKDGVALSNGSNISGATTTTLTVSGVSGTDEADYSVTVSNPLGAVDSAPATLTVIIPPSVTTQPQGQTVNAGDSASFSVVVSGTAPLYYQWKQGTTPLVDGANVFGANSASLILANVSQADVADYSVTITNGAGLVTSSTAHLTVIDPPVITNQPTAQTVAAGTTVMFNASASGVNLSYEWRKNGIAVSDGGNVSGATSASLTLSTVSQADVADYSVLVSNSAGNDTSSSAHLTVVDAPSIATGPSSRTNNPNTIATFTVSASGQNLAYSWKRNGSPLSNGGNISGVTSATLTVANVTQTDAADYSVTVTNIAGSQTSTAAHLTIVSVPAISAQPSNTTNNPGETATFSVTASSIVSVTYQWKKNNAVLNDSTNVSGTTSGTLTISSVSQTDVADYSVTVSNSAGSTNSSSAHLTVNSAPSLLTQPVDQIKGLGTNALLTVTASGAMPLTYHWKKDGTTLNDGGNISGANSSSLTISGGDYANTGNYSVVVSNNAGSITSDEASVQFIARPIITTDPVGETNAVGAAVALSVSATGTNLTYQWRKDGVDLTDSGTEGAHVSGATLDTLTIPSSDTSDSGTYEVIVANEAGSVTSSAISLKIINPPVIVTQPKARTNGVNTTATFSVVATGGSPLVYQWRKDGSPLLNGGKIIGASTANLTITGVNSLQIGDYSVLITNADGTTLSTAAHLEVLAAPAIVVHPQGSTNVNGTTATLSVSAVGTGLTYQWKKAGISITDNYHISGANSSSLTLVNLLPGDTSSYSVAVSNVVGGVISRTATLKVFAPPVITAQPQSRTNVSGSTATFTVLCRGTATLGYQWKKDGLPLANSLTVFGTTTASLRLVGVSASDAGTYSVEITNYAGAATSTSASLVVMDAITIISQSGSTTNVAGTTATFNVLASGTNPTYQWRKGATNLVNNATVSGADTDTLQLQNLQLSDAGLYSVTVSNWTGKRISTNIALTVVSGPIITRQPTNQLTVWGASAVFTVAVTGTAPFGYQWFKDGSPLTDSTHIVGANAASLTVRGATNLDEGSYSVTITNSIGTNSSSTASLTIVPSLVILKPTANLTITSGLTNVIGTASDRTNVAQVLYQWNDGPFTAATGTTNWTTPPLAFIPGTNVIAVKSINSAGRESQVVTRSYFYPVAGTLNLTINGLGTVTPNLTTNTLYVGRNYFMTAIPGVGQLFSNWTGTYSTNAKVLTFRMQPNVDLQVNFVTNLFLPRAGTYTGLFMETNGVQHESSGWFKFVLASAGSYSGQFFVAGVSRTMSGQFDLSGKTTFNYTGSPAVTVRLDLDTLSGISDRVLGTISNANWVAELGGDRVVYNTTNLTPRAGKYLMALTGTNDGTSSPGGDGYATVIVATNGIVSVVASLSDGTAFSQSSFISKDGQWPLYAALYASKGSVLGWMTITNREASSVEGDVSWIKKDGTPTITYYAGGFTNDLVGVGSTVSSLSNGLPALSLTNGVVIFGGGDLSHAITNTISLATNNVFTVTAGQPDGLSLAMDKNTGLITGSFFDLNTGAKVPFKGMLLQQQNTARGYFISSPNHVTGSFLLKSN